MHTQDTGVTAKTIPPTPIMLCRRCDDPIAPGEAAPEDGRCHRRCARRQASTSPAPIVTYHHFRPSRGWTADVWDKPRILGFHTLMHGDITRIDRRLGRVALCFADGARLVVEAKSLVAAGVA